MVSTLEKPREIQIPSGNMGEMIVEIVGDKELITNTMDEKTRQTIAGTQSSGGKTKGSKKEPRGEVRIQDEYERSMDLDADGDPCVKAIGLKHAMRAACRNTGNKMTHILQMIYVYGDDRLNNGDLLKILPAETEEAGPYMRRDNVRLANGNADLRYRAGFKKGWRIQAKIKYDANSITRTEVLQLLQTAGTAVGLCEWRVEKGGERGTFHIDSVLALTDDE